MMCEPLGRRLLLAAFSWPSDGATNIGADDIQVTAGSQSGVAGVFVTQVHSGGIQVFYPDCTALTVNLGDGADRLLVGDVWVATTVYGGNGNDSVTTSWAADVIYGESGNDYLNGGWGGDYLEGSGGNDELQGGANGDTLLGGGNDDTIYGHVVSGIGSDDKSTDDDNISGGDGYDTVVGQFGTDDIAGGTGHDSLTLGEQGGILQGGAGNDSLYGGAGVDNLNGNEGNDFFHTLDSQQDYAIRGGSDYDTLVTYDAVDLTIPTGGTAKRFDSIESVL